MNALKQLLILILLFLSVDSFSFESKNIGPYFSGKIIKNEISSIDSLQIGFFKDCLWGSNGLSYFKVKVTNTGEFQFRLPQTNKPVRMKISIFVSGKARTLKDFFYTEPNDSISINIFNNNGKDSLCFYGKNSSKYNLTIRLFDQFSKFSLEKSNLNFGGSNDTSKLILGLLNLSKLISRYSDQKTKIIMSYENELPSLTQQLITYEYGNYYDSWRTVIMALYSGYSDSFFKTIVRDHYNLNNSKFDYQKSEFIYLTPRYLASLSFKFKLDLLIKNNSHKVEIGTFYNIIKNQYDGIIRERLLFDFFVNPYTLQNVIYNQITYDLLLDEAHQIIKAPYLSTIFENKLKFKKGTKFFESEFDDINGNKFSTKSLLSKVYILDVWGVGCTGCTQFHQMFDREIYPMLKNNPKFEYLSVNIDRTKDRWLNGLKSNLYSSNDYLNVFTGGLGIDHPFLRYYNVQAIPFILLIDQRGRLISKLTAGGLDKKEIFQLINFGLNDNETR